LHCLCELTACYFHSLLLLTPHVAVQSVIYEYCTSCQKRLQWIVQVGAKRGLRKPNMDEVRQAKVSQSLFTE